MTTSLQTGASSQRSVVSGCTTVLQAIRVGRVIAGNVLIMGASGAFITVCAAAMQAGQSIPVVRGLSGWCIAARDL